MRSQILSCLILAYLSLHMSLSLVVASNLHSQRRPVIGVLAQAAAPEWMPYGDTYIYAAYVKFIEQAGALVVPIRTHQTEEYYKDMFNKLNGVVFPGGGVSIVSSPYEKAAEYFYNMSIEANDQGDFFPTLGICLGFEELTARRTYSSKLVRCDGEDFSVPLALADDARQSRLFKNLPDHLYKALMEWNLTYNHHQYCMSTQVFEATPELDKFYKVLSTNIARDGVEFVSTIEAKKYPFYGTQWHPEKNIYLWSGANVNHSAEAVQVTQYIADFFVSEAHKSKHTFSVEDLAEAVIFNYKPQFMGEPSFHNIYFFPKHCLFGNWWQLVIDDSGSIDGLVIGAVMVFLVVLLLFILSNRTKVQGKYKMDIQTVHSPEIPLMNNEKI